MRILINGLFLIPNRVGGSETYLRGLVQGLSEADRDNEYILCLGPEAAPTFAPPNQRWRIISSTVPSRRRAMRLALEQVWIPQLAARAGADVIHSAGYTGPIFSTAARVTTIHDMNYRRHPEDLSRTERTVYSVLIPVIAARSQRVLTVSEAARQDILRWTRVAQSSVVAVHHGARTAWPGDPTGDAQRLAAAGIVGPFFLSVATSYPHKNLERLVSAFPLEQAPGPPIRLVVVGLKGRGQPAIETARESRGDLVSVLGWVDDALLASLYRRSLGLAFPSLHEGFGLPIVEAMALGTAVVTSNAGAMAEVAGNAAQLVDPYSVGSIRDGLRRVAFDQERREELRRLGHERAASFTWRRAAEATIELYSAALTAAT